MIDEWSLVAVEAMSVTFTVPSTDLELNVANRSASLILFGLWAVRLRARRGQDEVDPWGGELDPADVVRQLATAETRLPGLVSPEQRDLGVYLDANGVWDGCLVVEAAYDKARIKRYVLELGQLAERAASLGEVIFYG